MDNPSGTIVEAFNEHQRSFDGETIQRWRDALSTVAAIASWDSQNCFGDNEATLIDFIIRYVSNKLPRTASSDAIHLIGIDCQITEIDKLLDFESNDLRMIGIWGIASIEKTAIAEFIYNRDYNKFDAYCFLRDVKGKYNKEGAITLQKELLFRTLFGSFGLNICTMLMGYGILERRLHDKKVLLLFDDVDNIEQLIALANNSKWFGLGSKIIITTRDKHVLTVHEVNYVYEVQTLNTKDSLQLFCRNAFIQNESEGELLELSNDLVNHARRLLLALVVVGRSLYDQKMMDVWVEKLNNLKRFPNLESTVSYE